MKHIKLYLTALLFAALGFTSCNDEFDTPPLTGPVATLQPNTTISELKALYWQDATNYVDTVGLTEDGHHMVIKGRVVSSDASGNIYKNLVIQDETAAITFSINGTDLYNSYRLGQEVVIDVTNMYIGKYSGLQQFGFPDNDPSFGWQTTFMPLEFFKEHVQLNGLPDASKVDTLTTTMSALPGATDIQGIQNMQSRLVRFDNVSWQEAGQPFAESEKTLSRTLVDAEGKTLTVRNSGYADFYNKTLPEGEGSVVGILGYFNGTWQLTLRSYEDCIFGNQEGTKNSPYKVSEAIAGLNEKEGWVEGVIVGAVAPGVSQVASNSDIEWKAPFTLDNTIVIAESADVRDYTKCMVVELPANSKLREIANLQDNPDNVGETIKLKGKFTTVLGMAGISENLGTSSEFVYSGTVTVSSIDENFDSYGTSISGLLETGWTSVTVQGNKDWFLKEFDSNTYASMTGYKGTAPFESWLITPAINVDNLAEKVFSFRTQVADYGSVNSKFEVYVLTSNDPKTATKTKVNPVLADPATAGSTPYSEWANSGNIDLSSFAGKKVYIGFCYSATQDAEYATWCLDDVKVGTRGEEAPNTGDRDGSAEKPYTVADVLTNVQGTGVWVKGYIVGYASSTVATESAVFGVTGTVSKTNLLLADSANEKDVNNCISVALPIGAVRNALNLNENPGNLGKLLTIKGDLGTNLYIPGVKSPTEYKLGE